MKSRTSKLAALCIALVVGVVLAFTHSAVWAQQTDTATGTPASGAPTDTTAKPVKKAKHKGMKSLKKEPKKKVVKESKKIEKKEEVKEAKKEAQDAGAKVTPPPAQ